jgi:plasmid stability protein
MPTLTIRNLPEPVHRRLRLRAAAAGRSVEAEVRAILAAACAEADAPASAAELQAVVDALYGEGRPAGVVEDLLAERRREAAAEAGERTPAPAGR